MTDKSIFVVIVTFRRPVVLASCLQSLSIQNLSETDHVHVVVNSDDSETIDTITSFQKRFKATVSYQVLNNEGPAGGFYFGVKKFLEESRADYVWLMDDDIIVEKNCLNALLNYPSESEYRCPKVITPSSVELQAFGWWGVLLGRKIVEKSGLPLKELFYWAEDSEYLQYRISWVNGFKPLRIESATVQHLHNRVAKRPSWYYYYTSRNTLYYRIYCIGLTKYGVKVVLGIVPYLTYTILKREDRKIVKLKMLLLGVYHGLVGRIGKLVDPQVYV